MFGAVLALGSADAATVGAVAPQLEHALRIGNAKIGLLSSVALLVGAAFVMPVGVLVDRVKRIPLLSANIVLWSIASLATALAGAYGDLLLSRLALGAVTAKRRGPPIASLTGDYFPAQERGRIYAYILGGEAAGTAVGFTLSGAAASLITWRAAFVLLAVPGFFLARTLWRTLPEPRRGGQSRLEPGTIDLGTTRVETAREGEAELRNEPDQTLDELARAAAQRRGVRPIPGQVLTEDPRALGLVRAVRYILSVPTNVLLIVGSSFGYFFFAGIQTFALLGHYHVDQATATLGLGLLVLDGLIGTLLSGHVTDLLLRRGLLTARVSVPAVCYLGAAGLLIPGILIATFTPAVWFDIGGMALIAAANPPLDAARLDIMPVGLWGRAESRRRLARSSSRSRRWRSAGSRT